MRSSFPLSAVFAFLLLPSSWGLCAQEFSPDFSSIDSNLEKLESLITDTLIGIPAAALISGLTVGIVMGVK
jgi:hypothetical protein